MKLAPGLQQQLRVVTATTSTTNCCNLSAPFPLLGWLNWLERADGSRKVPGSSPGLNLTFTEARSSGNKLPQHTL
uniref:Uncharacterized protein n=1 Tax=Romanomermis culicivorax TaxID=13658 RepID=A0A915HQT0_ROMCU